jgi:LPXTG-motif cell wall-anchored protein
VFLLASNNLMTNKGDENHADTKPDCIEVQVLISLYSYISGEGSTWTKSTGLPLRFQFKNSRDDSKTFLNFSGAQVDGNPLTRDKEYTASPGSVIIELKSTYLETLSVGEHTLTAEFTDGTAEAKFTVAKGEPINLPQTGDKNNVLIYALIGLIALSGLSLVIKKR